MNWSRVKTVIREGAPVGLLVFTTLAFWRWCVLNKFVIAGPDIYTTDLYSQFYPKFIYGAQRLASGDIPLWNPQEFCGAPFLATLHAEVFYPPKHILFSVFTPPVAIHLFNALHVLMASLFAYLFFRATQVSRLSSLVASLIWAFSVPLMFEAIYDSVRLATLSWFPLTLLLLELLMKRGQAIWSVLLGISLAFQFLAGYPTVLIPCIASLFIYYAVSLLGMRISPEGFERRQFYRSHTLLLFSACLWFSLVAVQFLPFYELLGESHRAGGIASVSRFDVKFLSPLSLFSQSGEPQPNPLFMGCAVFLVSLYGVIFSTNSLKRFLVLGGTFAVLMSLGPTTPVGSLVHRFPPFKYSRYPFMWEYLFFFFVGGCAGLGLDYLRRESAPLKGLGAAGRQRLWRKENISLLMLVSYALVFALIRPDKTEAMLVTVTLAAVLGLLLLKKPLLKEAIAVALALLVGGIYLTVVVPPGQFIRFPTKEMDQLAAPSKNPGLSEIYKGAAPGRIYSHDLLWESEHLFSGIRLVNGYDRALNIGRMKKILLFYGYSRKFVADWSRFVKSPLFLDLMSAQLIFVPPDQLELFGVDAERDSLPVDDSGYYGVRNKGALPRCFLVHDSLPLQSGDEVFQKLVNNEVDPSRVVLLEENLPGDVLLQEPQEMEAPPKITSEKPEEIIIEANPRGGAFLVLSDSYYPGWKAYDNGDELHIYRANYLFRAVYLTPGPHVIRFSFEPASFMWGARISIAGMVVTCAGLAYLAYQRLRGTARAET
jgi:hypothetical protein